MPLPLQRRFVVAHVLVFLTCIAGCSDDPKEAAKPQATPTSPAAFAARAGSIERTPLAPATPTPGEIAAVAGLFPQPGIAFSARIVAEPDGGGAPLTVRFAVDGDVELPGVRYMWDFGDRSTGRGLEIEHTFWQPGDYEVTLRAIGDGFEDSDFVTISVEEEGFDVQVDADPDIGIAPLTVNFAAVLDEDEPGSFYFQWEFGDGGRDISNPTTHTYRTPGTYTALLTVTNAAGQKAVRDLEIQVDSGTGE